MSFRDKCWTPGHLREDAWERHRVGSKGSQQNVVEKWGWEREIESQEQCSKQGTLRRHWPLASIMHQILKRSPQ